MRKTNTKVYCAQLIATASTERRNVFAHRRAATEAASQIKASNWTLLSNCLSRYDTVSRHTHTQPTSMATGSF